MKETVVIGDIHGSYYWREIIKENPGCRFIFLGDYLDPYQYIHDDMLINNFQEIIDLKSENDKDVILLLGNHDMHYITEDIPTGTRYDHALADYIGEMFQDNRNLFQYAFQDENYIFVHAGISQYWFLNDFKGDPDKNIADQLNNPKENQRAALFECGKARGGSGPVGGIFWADRKELIDPLQGYIQVVGHNRVPDITEFSEGSGKIIFCDSLVHHKYLKLQ